MSQTDGVEAEQHTGVADATPGILNHAPPEEPGIAMDTDVSIPAPIMEAVPIGMDVLSIPAAAERSTHTATAMPLPPSPVAGPVGTHGPNYPTMTQAMPEPLLAELLWDAHTRI